MIRKFLTAFFKIRVWFYIILFINLVVISICLYHKQGFHSDEQFSYAHANSSLGAYFDPEINSFYEITNSIKKRLYNHWIDSSFFQNYLTVQKSEKFSYSNIYHNLSVVEHPPLYFILLHTVCSLFPDSFNKWYAGSLNLVFFILIYIVLFRLANTFLKDEKLALCCVALWGFSQIGVASVVFLRMYLLQTLLMLCLLLQTALIIKENTVNKKQLFGVFLSSFGGIFTQYNSIFLSFFIALSSGVVFLCRKNYKILIQFETMLALSFLALFIFFPSAYDVLFHSLRGTEVLNNQLLVYRQNDIMEILYVFDIKISNFLQVFCEQFLAFRYTFYKFLVFFFIFSLSIAFYLRLSMTTLTKWLISIWLLYFIYLLSMPYMHIFHSRYYMCLMPLLALFLIMILKNLFDYIQLKKSVSIVIIVFLVAVNSLRLNFNHSPYAFIYQPAEQETIKDLKNKSIFIDSWNNVIFLHAETHLLAKADKVFITDNICDKKVLNTIQQTKGAVILTYSSYIFQTMDNSDIQCLRDINFFVTDTICVSQHCYHVWKKKPSNEH